MHTHYPRESNKLKQTFREEKNKGGTVKTKRFEANRKNQNPKENKEMNYL